MRNPTPLILAFAALAGFAAGTVLAQPTAPEIATDTPAATVTSLQRGLLRVAAEHSGASLDERYRLLAPWIEGTHDLGYIAEFALRRQWSALGNAERMRFAAAFERLSIMTYAARFVSVGPGTFAPVVPGALDASDRAEVGTGVMRADGTEVSLRYLLQREPDGWRIINIIADGVSDLALKRAEYQRLLSAGSIDTLITELDAQTERLRSD